jgi:hypothetical protein
MGVINQNNAYKLLAERISELLHAGRQQAYRAVNEAMSITYWEIGRLIVEEEQQGNERAGYGDFLIQNLSQELKKQFGNGFSASNLRNFRQFYLLFPIRYALRSELTWTHYRLLMRVENPKARSFYEEEAIQCGWSTRALERQINVPSEAELKAELERERHLAEIRLQNLEKRNDFSL